MLVEPLDIPDVKLVLSARLADERGFFSETYNKRALQAGGIDAEFVQDNHSLSRQMGVLRGLHFQVPPRAQGKLVRCVRGAIYDVAVDLRQGSPTFGGYVSAVLSADNWTQIWVPVGFAHGFCTLEPNSEVIYKVTDYYDPAFERGIAFDDPTLNISWPIAVEAIVLSIKDRDNPRFNDRLEYFVYVG